MTTNHTAIHIENLARGFGKRNVKCQATGWPETELFARSENQFCTLYSDAEGTFYRNASGEVDRLVCVLSGETYEAKKVP